MTYKVVISRWSSGFGLSDLAIKWLKDRKVKVINSGRNLPRHHPLLVQCVEELKEKANGPSVRLSVKKIKGNKYRIDSNFGIESLVEPNEKEWTVIKS